MKKDANEEPEPGQKPGLRDRFLRKTESFSSENGGVRGGARDPALKGRQFFHSAVNRSPSIVSKEKDPVCENRVSKYIPTLNSA
ncbi:MAG: hypothetical protein J5757_06865 [Lachnospiraceae bacterium]|nr:hypothetical protein [Lachnospiraceae bacterium]